MSHPAVFLRACHTVLDSMSRMCEGLEAAEVGEGVSSEWQVGWKLGAPQLTSSQGPPSVAAPFRLLPLPETAWCGGLGFGKQKAWVKSQF